MKATGFQRSLYSVAALGLLALFVFVVAQRTPGVTRTGTQSQLAAVDASDPALVGWWKLDDGSGSSAADSSSGGRTGSIFGTPNWVAGKVGGALNFDGSSNAVETTAPSALSGSSAFTVSFWAKPTVSVGYGGNVGVSIRSGTLDSNSFFISTTDAHGGYGAEVVWANSAILKYVTTSLTDGNWHFYTLVSRSSTDHELFVDGTSVARSSTPESLASGLTNIDIGAKYTYNGTVTGSHSGPIDDVRIFSRALGTDEIQALYTGGGGTAQQTTGSTGGTTSTTQTTTQTTQTTQTTTTGDTSAPTVPFGLSVSPVSSSQINLLWTASFDSNGVAGYKIYRNGTQIGTSNSASYSDTGLSASTAYTYTVAAYDPSNNLSAQSGSVSGTTLANGAQPTNRTLTLYKYEYAGQGTVTATVNGTQVINCGSSCTAAVPVGATIVFSAAPNTGSSLARWEDCPGSSGNTCTIVMPNWNMPIGAFFTSGGFNPQSTLASIVNLAATKGGLTWAFTGDSFTTLNTESAYFESYFQLHYPNLHFHFRNMARSGSQIANLVDDPTNNPHLDPNTGANIGFNVDDAFDAAVYGLHPDVVSVDFSDNGFPSFQKLHDDIVNYITHYIVPNHSIPVILGAWPQNGLSAVTEGALMEGWSDADDLAGRDTGSLTASIWHEMAPMMLKNLCTAYVAGVCTPNPNPVNLNGLANDTDQEHLNEAATLAAATYTLFKLGADGDVSDVTVNANTGALVSQNQATVTGVAKNSYSGVDFTRADSRLPMAFDDISRPILQIAGHDTNAAGQPDGVLDMNRYMLTVTGLSAGNYDVYIDGKLSATVDSNTLASGWNMTTMTQGPIHDQLVEVLGRIRDKEGASRTRLFQAQQLNAAGDPTNTCVPAGYNWWGDANYGSQSGYFNNPGQRGDVLAARLDSARVELACLDDRIHAAAQPIPRTFSIRKSGSTAPVQSASDTTLPTVSVTAPTNNATVSGTVTISATASDDTAVAGVQFKVDGTNIGTEDTSSSYSASWDSTMVTNGTHTITAIARDTSNNTKTSTSVTVTVNNVQTSTRTLAVTTTGSGSVASSPAGITCGSTCSASFTSGASVTLTATPTTGNTFSGWSGACSGTGTCTVTMSANTSVSAAFAVAGADTTPPGFTSVDPTAITQDSATIIWYSRENADTQVNYGLTSAYGSNSVLDPSMITALLPHKVVLTGLTPNTLYHFKVLSKDAAGNLGASSDLTFTTEPSGQAATTLYADNTLASDCTSGNYSISARSCTGTDGKAFTTVQKALNVVNPGDTIYVRGGTFTGASSDNTITRSGAPGAVIQVKPYNSESVTFDGGGNWHQAFATNYSSYYTISGFSMQGFAGDGVSVISSGNITLDHLTISNGAGVGNGVGVANSNHISITNSIVHNVFGSGIRVGSHFQDDGTLNSDILIEHNYLHHIGNSAGQAGDAMPIWHSTNVTERNNVAHDIVDCASSGGEVYNSLFENNTFYNLGYIDGVDITGGGGDGCGFKFSVNVATSSGNRTFRGNSIFYYGDSAFEYIGDSGDNFYHNTTVGGHPIAGFNIARGGAPGQVKDNISCLSGADVQPNNNGLVVSNNIFCNGNVGSSVIHTYPFASMSTSSVIATIDTDINSPTFGRVGAFVPQAGSSAIDAGTVVSGYDCPVSDDSNPNQTNCRHWKGAAPDDGAYEYGIGTQSTITDNTGNGATYYVDGTNGSDSNAGTLAAPFKTIQKAANIVNPGDTVSIKAGTYKSTCSGNQCHVVTISRSGTSGNMITFQPYGNGPVLLTGWTTFSDAQDPSTTTPTAIGPADKGATRETLVSITGNYIHVTGLDLGWSVGAGMAVDGSHDLIDNVVAHDNWIDGFGVGLSATGRVEADTLLNVEAHNNRHGYGIQIGRRTEPGVTTDILNNVTVKDSLSYLNGRNSDGTEVLPIGGDPQGGGNSDGIVADKFCYFNLVAPYDNMCQHVLLDGNVIWGNNDDGFDLSFAHSVVSNNISFHNGPTASEGFKNFKDVTDNVFVNNISYDNLDDGFQLRTAGVVFLNNTSVGNVNYGAWGVPLSGNVHNNITYANNTGGLITKPELTSGCTSNCLNNWIGGDPKFYSTKPFQDSSGKIVVNLPSGTIAQKVQWMKDQFKNAFSLQPGSGALDTGTPASYVSPITGQTVSIPYYGTAPDMGALEYQNGQVITPPTTPSNPAPTDSDGDGVPDSSDKCLNTPSGRTVNSVGCPLPSTTGFTVTPGLASLDLNSVSNLTISNSFGKIAFTSPVSLVHNGDSINLGSVVSLTKGTITVNSAAVPELNKPATITFNNIVLSSLNALKILRDGAVCPSCTAVTYINNTLNFSVPGF